MFISLPIMTSHFSNLMGWFKVWKIVCLKYWTLITYKSENLKLSVKDYILRSYSFLAVVTLKYAFNSLYVLSSSQNMWILQFFALF